MIQIGKFVQRKRVIKRIGIDTDNCFSWMDNEKSIPKYKPRIAQRRNFLYTNYVVLSELMNLLSNKNPNVNREEVIKFLNRNHISPIRRDDVNETEVEETLNKLKIERKNKNWLAGDNDLKIISVYHCAKIDCISTNNLKHFREPCDYLGMDIDFPKIIQIGSRQDVNRMLRNLYRNH